MPLVTAVIALALTCVVLFIAEPDVDYVLWDRDAFNRSTMIGLPWKVCLHTGAVGMLMVSLSWASGSKEVAKEVLALLIVLGGLLAVIGTLLWTLAAGLSIEMRDSGYRGFGGHGTPCRIDGLCHPLMGLYWSMPAAALFLDAITMVIVRRWEKRFWSVYWSLGALIVQISAAAMITSHMTSSLV